MVTLNQILIRKVLCKYYKTMYIQDKISWIINKLINKIKLKTKTIWYQYRILIKSWKWSWVVYYINNNIIWLIMTLNNKNNLIKVKMGSEKVFKNTFGQKQRGFRGEENYYYVSAS